MLGFFPMKPPGGAGLTVADTGWLSPAAVDSTTLTGSSKNWTTTSSAQTENGASANSGSGSGYSNYLRARDFGVSVPAGATILGVECRYKISQAGSGSPNSKDRSLRLLSTTGTVVGGDKADTGSNYTGGGTLTFQTTKGGAGDLWGNALTESWVEDVDFGVAYAIEHVSGIGSSVNCDVIQLKVHYQF